MNDTSRKTFGSIEAPDGTVDKFAICKMSTIRRKAAQGIDDIGMEIVAG
jgi:hypothetical protein